MWRCRSYPNVSSLYGQDDSIWLDENLKCKVIYFLKCGSRFFSSTFNNREDYEAPDGKVSRIYQWIAKDKTWFVWRDPLEHFYSGIVTDLNSYNWVEGDVETLTFILSNPGHWRKDIWKSLYHDCLFRKWRCGFVNLGDVYTFCDDIGIMYGKRTELEKFSFTHNGINKNNVSKILYKYAPEKMMEIEKIAIEERYYLHKLFERNYHYVPNYQKEYIQK